jgi:hypothetical protein
MKQTSIEWLVEQICGDHTKVWHDVIEQAKKLHMQEIIKAWNDGISYEEKNGQQYYLETFKKD